ncbi:MAG: T9SS type A sorting domain-containing protein [Bacteroidota bacterium]
MKKFLLITVMFSEILICTAQNNIFQKQIKSGNGYGYASGIETNGGGFAFVGAQIPTSGADVSCILTATNNLGTPLWTRAYGYAGTQIFSSIQQTSDGGFVLGGTSDHASGVSGSKGIIVKTNSSGDTTWCRAYGGEDGEEFTKVRQTEDGGYIAIGKTSTSAGASDDIYVVKVNTTGAIQWTRTFGVSVDNDWGSSVEQTSDQGYIIAGAVFDGVTHNACMIRLNSSGDTLWTCHYNGASYDYGYNAIQTQDGGFILVGSTYSTGSGNGDILVVKTDPNGNTQWSKVYGTSETETGLSILQLGSGDYLIGANQDANLINYVLLKITSTGSMSWSKQYGTNDLTFQDMNITQNDGALMSGVRHTASGFSAFVVKADGAGNAAGCNTTDASLIEGNGDFTIKKQVVVGTSGNAYSFKIVATTITTTDSTLCSGLDINENTEKFGMTVFPNPTSGHITLDLGDAQNFSEIKIYNSIGGLVGSENVKSVSGKVNIDLSQYGKGLFLLTSSNTENTFSVKVLVE